MAYDIGVGRRDGSADAQVLTAQIEEIHGGDGVVRRLGRVVFDESVAAVLAGRRSLGQLAHLDAAERLEDALDVVFRQVRVHRGDEDAVVVAGLFHDLVDDGLSLRHVARSSHL